ncbi:MAG: ZIP family metal transporter [Pseudonocardia sp.]
MLDNRSSTREPATSRRPPLWLLGTALAALIAAALAALAVFGGATLPERTGPPIEELTVERAVLTPGTIALTVRGAGADPVQIAQVTVNDVFVDFTGGEQPVDRLTTATLVLDVPWQDGQPYLIGIITSTGLVIEHEIPAAVATPEAGGGVVTTMVLLGTYVGILPVLLGMLVLPLLRRAGATAVRVLLALTVGLLGFLAVDATLDGLELLGGVGAPFGGAAVVLLGAALAYLALAGVDGLLDRGRSAAAGRPGGLRLAVLIAVGIGLHNLGEGLAIGSAFAVGELALGTALVVGFALHNTTEGLAIVAPLTERRPGLPVLAGLGLLAGAPAVAGALLGAAVDNPVLSALLLGVGVGAIIGVIGQILPALRGRGGRLLDPPVAGGLAAGIVVMYLTGLLVAA